jgi:hypothetical protein
MNGWVMDACTTIGGKDRVLGVMFLYSHSSKGSTPVYRQGCVVVFVLDTNSLRHLFKHTGFPDEAEPVGAFHSPPEPGNMDYAHVSVASVEGHRPD